MGMIENFIIVNNEMDRKIDVYVKLSNNKVEKHLASTDYDDGGWEGIRLLEYYTERLSELLNIAIIRKDGNEE